MTSPVPSLRPHGTPGALPSYRPQGEHFWPGALDYGAAADDRSETWLDTSALIHPQLAIWLNETPKGKQQWPEIALRPDSILGLNVAKGTLHDTLRTAGFAFEDAEGGRRYTLERGTKGQNGWASVVILAKPASLVIRYALRRMDERWDQVLTAELVPKPTVDANELTHIAL